MESESGPKLSTGKSGSLAKRRKQGGDPGRPPGAEECVRVRGLSRPLKATFREAWERGSP